MIVLSRLNFLIDEYIEGLIEHSFSDQLDAVQSLIQAIFSEFAPAQIRERRHGGQATVKHSSQGVTQEESPGIAQRTAGASHPGLEGVKTVLQRYIDHIVQHPTVLYCQKSLQRRLTSEVQTFLLAHVTYAEDNQRFSTQRNPGVPPNDDDERPLHNGGLGGLFIIGFAVLPRTIPRVHSRSSSSISSSARRCPAGLQMFLALRARPMWQKTSAATSRACAACTTTNTAPWSETPTSKNLNSVNFPEFHPESRSRARAGVDTWGQEAKRDLLWIADYERGGLQAALDLLAAELGNQQRQTINATKLFINVTDLYGQIYVLKDIGTRTK